MNKKLILIPVLMIVVSIILEALAVFSKEFSIYYTDNIFPVITIPLASLSNLFGFSVGEILLYMAVLLLLVFIISVLFLFIRLLFYKVLKKSRTVIPKWFKKYTFVLLFLVGIYSLIMVLNCFVLYQYPAMQGIRATSDEETQKLILLRDYVVTRANELSETLERDENGGLRAEEYEVLAKEAITAMQNLGKDEYPRLLGYYPKYKYFDNPAFFSQQYIMGYYFPFSMEANINGLMEKANLPHTICHELSHLKGYIREDEANFIAYLACMESGNAYFEYSALLSVLDYLDRDFYAAIRKDERVYYEHPVISDRVLSDNIFLSESSWEWVDRHSILNTEFVRKANQSFTDAVLTSNGVSDGIKSYSRVVGLLLNYYEYDTLQELIHNGD